MQKFNGNIFSKTNNPFLHTVLFVYSNKTLTKYYLNSGCSVNNVAANTI